MRLSQEKDIQEDCNSKRRAENGGIFFLVAGISTWFAVAVHKESTLAVTDVNKQLYVRNRPCCYSLGKMVL